MAQIVIPRDNRAKPPIGAIVEDYANRCREYNERKGLYPGKRGYIDPESVYWHKTDEGYGTHQHDEKCDSSCLKHLDNSDWIVTLRYEVSGNDEEHEAVYGVLNGQFKLWAD